MGVRLTRVSSSYKALDFDVNEMETDLNE